MRRAEPPENTGLIKVPRHLNRMVASGRITSDEADLLRSAEADKAAETIAGIRARHAGAVLDTAVADGRIGRAEADELLGRLRSGDHSAELRARINRIRRRIRNGRVEASQRAEGEGD